MRALIRKAERQLARRRFIDLADLTGKVYASLILHLEQRGMLPHRPFHAAACRRATVRDINTRMVGWFIQRAREERQLALNPKTPPKEALIRLWRDGLTAGVLAGLDLNERQRQALGHQQQERHHHHQQAHQKEDPEEQQEETQDQGPAEMTSNCRASRRCRRSRV
ncbi:MAG: hypothetical protein HY718_10260 [Planctomycetes bacterium]|nr:hypothetical protein [Planctomycetota bacterium]